MFYLPKILRNKYTIICLLMITFVAFINAFIPYSTSKILNYSLDKNGEKLMLWIIILLLSIALLLVFESISQYFTVKYKNYFRYVLTEDISNKIIKKDSESFSKLDNAEYINLFNVTIPLLEEEYYKKILDIYQGIVGILFNVSMLFVLDRVLVWIVVITNVIPLFIPLITKNKLATLKNDTATKSTNFNKKLIDILEGISVAKSFKVQNLILGKMFKSLKELNSSTERYEKKDVSLNLLSGISFYTSYFLILSIGAFRISKGLTSVGSLTGTVQISDNLIYPIRLVSEELRSLLSTKKIRTNINDMNLEEDIKSSYNFFKPKDDTVIEVKELTYSSNDNIIFDKVNVRFKKNKKYLLIGESGTGKSTFLRLLNNEIHSYTGEINIDYNSDIRVVYQKPYWFDTDLNNNLTMFETYKDDKQLEDIKKSIGLKNSLEQQSSGFSGGEMQKISIIRALNSNPNILFLDEATSALDKENYKRIENYILDNFRGTLITVSHRVDEGIKKKYDHILKLENNKINIIK